MGRVLELEVALHVAGRVLADVGGVHEELDRRCSELRSELEGRTDALRHGVGQRVVVEAARELPDRARSKGIVRFEVEQELLEVVEAVERGHRSGERTRGGAVDPPDPRPQRRLGEAAEEPELEQDAVDPAARQDHGDVATVGLGHEAIVPPWNRSYAPALRCSPMSTSRPTSVSGRETTTEITAGGSAFEPIRSRAPPRAARSWRTS